MDTSSSISAAPADFLRASTTASEGGQEDVARGIFFGTPSSKEPGFALFEPGALFGYYIDSVRRRRAYLCRWSSPAQATDEVPGLSHPVEVLCFAPSRTKAAKLERLLRHLEESRVPLDQAPLGFFARLNGLVEDSRTTLRTLRHLVRTSFGT